MKAASENVAFIESPDAAVTPPKTFQGWKLTAQVGLGTAIAVLATNIGLLIWAMQSPNEKTQGVSIIWSGSCDVAQKATIGSHLAINILSSALLAASNCGMQLISAPTREFLDAAHAQGASFDVGVQSLRNFRGMNWIRRLIWILLMLSSVPLHLLYNSIIVESIIQNQHLTVVGSRDFVQNGPWDSAADFTPCFYTMDTSSVAPAVEYLQQQQDSLIRLENADCIREYYRNPLTNYANVLLVTNAPTLHNNSILNLHTSTLDEPNPDTWMCSVVDSAIVAPTVCDIDQLVADAEEDSWRVVGTIDNFNDPSHHLPIPVCSESRRMFQVQYCLAQPTPKPCRIGLSSDALIAVIVSNAIKVLCLIWICLYVNFKPLTTIGDAIASFLDRPDPSTAHQGALQAVSLSNRGSHKPVLQPWVGGRRLWLRAARLRRWIISSICFATFWLICLIILVIGLASNRENGYDKNISQISAGGIGRLNPMQMVGDRRLSLTVISCSVLANIPQLLISALYFLYNDLVTRMHLVEEWSSFGHSRKGLRVQDPCGSQRRAYLLTIPVTSAAPLFVMMTLLHWLVSQSIFFSYIINHDYAAGGAEPIDMGPSVLGIGWSPLALILSLVVGGVLILGLWAIALIRRYKNGTPLVQSSSFAISAACHPPPWDVNAATMPVQYGVIPGLYSAEGYEHVGFSSGQVLPLTAGRIYI